jgi:small subunit ribosomal protein S2
LRNIDFDNNDEYKHLAKNEKLLMLKELGKLNRMLLGLEDLKNLPDAIFVIGADILTTPIKEAAIKKIPVIAVVDSNCSAEMVDYKIYGNDDSANSIALVLKIFESAVKAGIEDSQKKSSKLIKQAEEKKIEEKKESST